jgi:hypothetical protein
VVTRSRHGRTYQHPGHTTLEVKTAPEAAAFMTIDFWYGNHHLGQRWWKPPYTPQELAEARTFDFPWSCGPRGGGTIRYEARARGDTGETLRFAGSFHESLSARWCKAAKRRLEAAERRRGEREARNDVKNEKSKNSATANARAMNAPNANALNRTAGLSAGPR